MKAADLIRRLEQQAQHIETTTRTPRNVPRAATLADIERIEQERVPWLKKKRRRVRRLP